MVNPVRFIRFLHRSPAMDRFQRLHAYLESTLANPPSQPDPEVLSRLQLDLAILISFTLSRLTKEDRRCRAQMEQRQRPRMACWPTRRTSRVVAPSPALYFAPCSSQIC
ncbi:hypothetical protein AAT19DRAFT_16792 [Rhodotorula toruloides]|uniref:Uncharacterized protein n=1 Tax=Rhodotorula toruloides TaxID=5286 RepID=A0A2T0A4C2_RHOTO|nr:hypothetical protein AAT19DRAFT_16792 [Rhodotorula toruloides]